MSLLNCETGFESYGMAAFTRVLGMEDEKASAICEAASAASRNKNYHVYFKQYVPFLNHWHEEIGIILTKK
jgi:hypothetical protein